MAINIRHRDGVIIFKLDGKVFGPAALELRQAFNKQLENYAGVPKFLVDVADVTLMGSSGLGALTAAQVATEKKGGLIALVNVGPNIQNLMIRSRLIDVFEPFDSEDEAIEALNAD